MSVCTPCAEYMCPNVVVDGKFCKDHEKDHSTDTSGASYDKYRRENDPSRSRYNTGPFPKLSKILRGQNPICQKLNAAGIRCSSLSVLVHHRHSPRSRPDLFLRVFDENNVSQLICLCASDHPKDDGTPDWKEGIDFCRTEFRLGFA
jgi:hypothetical protein